MNKYENHTKNNATETFNTIQNFANVGLENVQKLAKLQLKISSDRLQQTSDTFKTLASIKNPQQLLEQVNEIAKTRIQANSDNYKNFIAIANDTKSKFLQASMEHFKAFRTANINNISKLVTKSQDKDFDLGKIANSFTNISNSILNDSKKVVDKAAHNTNKSIDSINTAVKGTVHATTKATNTKTVPHKKSAPEAATTHKKIDNSKQPVATKVVDEAKKVV